MMCLRSAIFLSLMMVLSSGAIVSAQCGMPPGGDHTDHMAVMALVTGNETHTATQSGAWTSSSTWAAGLIPSIGARVLIPQGIQVEFDEPSSPFIRSIRIDGNLNFSRSVSTSLLVDTIVITSCGRLEIGTRSNPIPSNKTVNISFKSDTPIDHTEDPTVIGRGIIAMGALEIVGSRMSSHLQLAADPISGSNVLQLTERPLGWSPGDRLLIPGTHFKYNDENCPNHNGTYDEERIIQSIDGTQVTLTQALQYSHDTPSYEGMQIRVGNLTRNIRLQNSTGPFEIPQQRAHIMTMSKDFIFESAALYGLGRTDKSIPVDETSNLRGRYAIHFHKTGADPYGQYQEVNHSVITRSPGWGIVAHQSAGHFFDNLTYDIVGSHIVTEDGNEVGVARHNMMVKSSGNNRCYDIKEGTANFDLARAGHGFWGQSRNFGVEHNFAYSHSSSAYVWFHRNGGGSNPWPKTLQENLMSPWVASRLKPDFNPDQVPIGLANNNLAAASTLGLHVIKANRLNASQPRNVFKSWRLFGNKDGAHVEYTQAYNFLDWMIVGDSCDDPWRTGFKIGSAARDFVFQVYLECTGKGIVLNSGSDNEFLNDQSDTPGGLPLAGDSLLDVEVGPGVVSGSEIVGFDLNYHRLVDLDQVLNSEVTFIPVANQSLPGNLGWQTSQSFLLQGALFDSVSDSWQIYPSFYDGELVRTHLQNEGAYTRPDGSRYLVLKETIADRGGDPSKFIQVEVEVDVPNYSFSIPNLGSAPTPPNLFPALGNDDFYSLPENSSLEIEAPGPLSNDVDNGSTQMLHLSSLVGPEHGKLSALQTGRIIYVPDTDFQGEDSFYYRLWNGDELSDLIEVRIQVGGENSCVVDIDMNGALDINDLDFFIQAFMAGEPAADIDQSGSINVDDISEFVRLFLEGCYF